MKRERLYIVLALVTICFWGTTFVSTKILLDVLSPVQIMLLRYVIAYVSLLAIHPKIHRPESLSLELRYVAAALFGSTLYFLAENFALSFTQAANVSLLISAAPILTSVVAHLATRDEHLTRHAVSGFFVAMAGIALVVFNGSFVLKLSPKGDLLAVAAALSWAFYSVILRGIHSRYPPVYVTRRIFFYSILTMLPCLLFDFAPFDATVLREPLIWGNLLFLGLIASSLCYVLWNYVVARLGAVRSNNFVYLNPLITMIASVIVLHERITLLMIAGALLILLGVIVSEGTLLKRRESAAQR
ncbi:DMT family transporter [Anaerotruncus colihominis]|uniref:DMT family transporter n=1 Tax=Anaerotruncus colihominis TaxID=169435 RepID=A0A845T0C6_9FIRM|nr:DMT family transporter [Anaerotruncus colihominis]MCR2026386.1 DMT family transporter [Anaerotruncus colihominis]NDO40628.1 DMT family transporter [Anaerotruncus colihominis]